MNVTNGFLIGIIASIALLQLNKQLRQSNNDSPLQIEVNQGVRRNLRLIETSHQPMEMPFTSNPTYKIPSEIQEARYAECEGRATSLTGGFCLTHQDTQGGNHIYDRGFAEYLAQNTFAGKTVVDLGAGLGHYGKIFMEEGSKVKGWVGYDGALNGNKVTEGLVKFMDLTQPDADDERDCAAGDFVISLEVGEHIPPQFTDAFMRNIRCHAKEGAVISWAKVGQGGWGHINNKDKDDVVELMRKWGFEPDWEDTEKLVAATKRWFLVQNAVVYRLK